jgi:glycosyltransferase involved in cell wall biosynthesis
MGLKTLALIIPAYNDARHLDDCLNAISKQSEMPDEVIVVDNNSTDNTTAVVKRYKFATLIQEKKQGIVYARNKGFSSASSDILGRIDTDTLLPTEWVYEVKKFYSDPQHKRHALTGGGYFYNVPLKVVNGWGLSQIAYRFNRFIMGHYILWGSNMSITREQWQAVTDQTCIRTDIHEDLDLAIHLHNAGYEITYRAGLKVGVMMRRVYDDWSHLYSNMMWWPRTLKVHGNKRWVLGLIGAYFLFIFSPVLVLINLPKKLLGLN